ncbi:MAG: IscS subfamily cysteine desulfurase, partial [Clostridia bacterium]
IAVSTGSACASGSLEPSHVLKAMGTDDEIAHSSIRFSFAKNITPSEVDFVVEKLRVAVKKLRSISAIRIYRKEED